MSQEKSEITETNESKVETLRQEIKRLEAKVELLNNDLEKARRNQERSLLKQIEILAVFVVIVALVITDVIGIDVLGSMGLRGVAMINLAYVVSTLLLLLGLKFIVIGSHRGA
ncbi:MAG: hypothetical protein LKK00_02995 [Intestinimonas sp.]|jgi:hypothetical protein|nr:hypothetical protein [Intestinimonas sp.]